jgi:hypothetical protein
VTPLSLQLSIFLHVWRGSDCMPFTSQLNPESTNVQEEVERWTARSRSNILCPDPASCVPLCTIVYLFLSVNDTQCSQCGPRSVCNQSLFFGFATDSLGISPSLSSQLHVLSSPHLAGSDMSEQGCLPLCEAMHVDIFRLFYNLDYNADHTTLCSA